MASNRKLLVLPGDGIGPECMSEVMRIADWFAPRAEATASNAHYEITMELPGVAQDDIEVSLHDGVLTVKGEKRSERKEEGEGYFFSEREYGRFQRTFRLPADARGDDSKKAL